MLRTKTTLGGTGSVNADNRGTEPAFVGVVPAQAAQSDSETARKKMERARKTHLQKGGESCPDRSSHSRPAQQGLSRLAAFSRPPFRAWP